MTAVAAPRRRGLVAALVVAAVGGALIVLLALGTWQVQRLAWKENLIATIEARVASPPLPLSRVESLAVAGQGVDYWPVTAEGSFRHEGERHFFATHRGRSGYFLYTPLELADGRFLLVNRGFVPFELKDPAMRMEGQVEGTVAITGLARDPLAGKPSAILPDNDPEKNVFYWKDLSVMAATSGVGAPGDYLPFFLDAGEAPNPGGLPVGGVTIVDLPNNHLQYAITWYGLALALVAVLGTWLWRGRRA